MPFLAPIVAAFSAFSATVAVGITAVTGLAVTGGMVGSFIIAAALNVGVAFLTRALAKKPAAEEQGPGGTELRLSTDPAKPRQLVLGERGVGGSLVYWCISGADSRYLDLVIVLADHLIDSVSGVAVDGKYVNWTMPPGSGANYFQHIGEYTAVAEGESGAPDPHMTIVIMLGRDDQVTPAELVTASGGQWNAAHRLAGCAYAWVRLRWHRQLFAGGAVPTFLWRVRGAPLYDPRQDSTVAGGSGAHVWGEPATYQWSDNLEVARYNFLRGIAWQNGRPRFGPGIDADEINLPAALAAMNTCQEAVNLAAGGVEARYRVSAVIEASEPYRAVLDRFSSACAGSLPDLSGAYAMLPGVAQTAVLTFADTDLVAGTDFVASPFRSLGEVVNEVTGDWRDPASLYQPVPIPARWSSIDEDLDGDFRRSEQFDTDYVASQTQGQRVLEIQRRLGRRQKTHKLTLRRRFSVLEAGDWIAWTSDIFGYTGQLFRVEAVTLNPAWTVTLDLREVDADVYAWLASDEIDAAAPADLPSAGPSLSTVEGFAVEAAVVLALDGTQLPAIRATWSPISDPTVTSIEIEYRRVGDTPWLLYRTSKDQVAAGAAVITAGIVGGDFHEARARLMTEPPRLVTVSPPAATPSATPTMIVHEAQITEITTTVPPSSIGVDDLDDLLKKAVVPGFKGGELDDRLLSALMARSIEFKQRRDALVVATKTASARLEQINTVLVAADVALAQSVLALQAVIEDPETGSEATAEAIQSLTTRVDIVEGDMTALASSLVTVEAKANMASAFGSAGLVAVATAGGSLASYRIQLAAGAAGSPMRNAGLRLDALSGGGTKMTVDADSIQFIAALFYMIDSTGNPRTVFSAASGAIDLNSNVRVGGNLVVAGTITAGAMAASARSQAVASSGNAVSVSTNGGRVSLVGAIVPDQVGFALGGSAVVHNLTWCVFRNGVQISATFNTPLPIIAVNHTNGAGSCGGEFPITYVDTPAAGSYTYAIMGFSGNALNGVANFTATVQEI